ncbi:MAG: NTP transferase domain-containing protein [Nostoc sp.]
MLSNDNNIPAYLTKYFYQIADRSSLVEIIESSINTENIHFIILAAGKSLRMKARGFHLPKLLFSLEDNETLLSRTASQISELSHHEIRLVVRSENYAAVENYIVQSSLDNFKLVIDDNPLGHGSAVQVAVRDIDANYGTVIILWCDMLYRTVTIKKSLNLHYALHQNQGLTMPTTTLDYPYASIKRDLDGNVEKLLFHSSGDCIPYFGEDNVGIFIFNLNSLKTYLSILAETTWKNDYPRQMNSIIQTSLTMGELFAPRIASRSDYLNINSPDDYHRFQRENMCCKES